MKSQEIQSLIQSHSEEQLRALVIELYQAIPRSSREDSNIDQLIADPDHPGKIETRAKKKPPTLNSQKESEIRTFLTHARAGLYLHPNRTISKEGCTKWRFRAKAYLQLLVSRESQEADPELAASLLEDLYRLLCHGCRYSIFRTEDPFSAIGVKQAEFLGDLFALKSAQLMPNDFIEFAIELILSEGTDRFTSRKDLMEVFKSYLKTPDMREMAIAACERKMAAMIKISHGSPKSGSWLFLSTGSAEMTRVNHLTEIYFFSCAPLGEFERAIEFHKKYNREGGRNPEYQLFLLLELLRRFDQKALWRREFEAFQRTGEEAREPLQREYQHLIENGTWLDYSTCWY